MQPCLMLTSLAAFMAVLAEAKLINILAVISNNHALALPWSVGAKPVELAPVERASDSQNSLLWALT